MQSEADPESKQADLPEDLEINDDEELQEEAMNLLRWAPDHGTSIAVLMGLATGDRSC